MPALAPYGYACLPACHAYRLSRSRLPPIRHTLALTPIHMPIHMAIHMPMPAPVACLLRSRLYARRARACHAHALAPMPACLSRSGLYAIRVACHALTLTRSRLSPVTLARSRSRSRLSRSRLSRSRLSRSRLSRSRSRAHACHARACHARALTLTLTPVTLAPVTLAPVTLTLAPIAYRLSPA